MIDPFAVIHAPGAMLEQPCVDACGQTMIHQPYIPLQQSLDHSCSGHGTRANRDPNPCFAVMGTLSEDTRRTLYSEDSSSPAT